MPAFLQEVNGWAKCDPNRSKAVPNIVLSNEVHKPDHKIRCSLYFIR